MIATTVQFGIQLFFWRVMGWQNFPERSSAAMCRAQWSQFNAFSRSRSKNHHAVTHCFCGCFRYHFRHYATAEGYIDNIVSMPSDGGVNHRAIIITPKTNDAKGGYQPIRPLFVTTAWLYETSDMHSSGNVGVIVYRQVSA